MEELEEKLEQYGEGNVQGVGNVEIGNGGRACQIAASCMLNICSTI